ncbi:MAG: hypothetical protein OEW79_06330 [Betaproteobacteria bacterium]|nr:hypothetical protein [Betaproteobacteria bacterium]MDH5342435.1 hypothetical protein [Betaproteobacteria bacterium]
MSKIPKYSLTRFNSTPLQWTMPAFLLASLARSLFGPRTSRSGF